MKLYLIVEDIDLGYHCHGVFDNKQFAQEQLDKLIDAWASVRFYDDDERPLDYKKQSQMYLEEHTLNSTRIVDDGIKRSEDYCQMRKNPNHYYKQ
jgi:hypothetical protein